MPLARHWLVDQLTAAGHRRQAQDAAVCVSELASNAVDHTRYGFEITLSDGTGTIRVEVTDDEAQPPELRPVNADADRGRGMLILDAIADRWGVEAHPAGRGKTVWFELD